MKLTAKNFEVLTDLELPIEGITVLVGASNNGKSSVCRAIESVFCNTPGDSYIQYGKSQSTVGLTVPHGGVNHSIVRNRDARGTVYFVDGEKYEKVGRKNHLDLLYPFGIKELQAGDRSVIPSMIRQFDPQFLTSYTPSESFSFLSFLLDESRMQAVLKSISSSVRVQNEELGQIKAVIDVNQAEMLEMEKRAQEVDAVLYHEGQLVEIAIGQLLALETQEGALSAIPGLSAEISSLQATLRSGLSDVAAFDVEKSSMYLKVTEVPTLLAAEDNQASSLAARREVRGLMDQLDVLIALSVLGNPEKLAEPVASLAAAGTDLLWLSTLHAQHASAEAALSFASRGSVEVPDGLAGGVGCVSTATGLLEVYSYSAHTHGFAVAALGSITVPEGAEKLASAVPFLTLFEAFCADHARAASAVKLQQDLLTDILLCQERALFDLTYLESGIDRCPMCNSTLVLETKSVLLGNLKGTK